MYILIKESACPNLKHDISSMIDNHLIRTWEFVIEEGKKRLQHTGDEQYGDVVIRFINTHLEGETYFKILPTIKVDAGDKESAESHLPIVLGRFAELLNSHFVGIGKYQTIL